MVLQAFQGIFMSWIEVGVNTLTVWIWKEKVGPYMQLLHFAYGMGLSAFPAIAGLSAVLVPEEKTTLQLIISYWSMAGFIILSAVFPFKLKSPPIEKDLKDHGAMMHQTRKVKEDPDHPSSTPTAPQKKVRVRYFVIVVAITLFLFWYGGAENAFGGWIAVYAEEFYGTVKEEADYLDSVFWFALTAGRFAAVPLAARFSARAMLVIDLSGCMLSSILMIYFSKFKSKILLWGCTVFLGLSMASIFGSAFTVPAELKVKVSGKAASAFIVASGIGDMVVPWLVSLMLKPLGNEALLWVLIGVFSLCALIYAGVFVFGLTTMEKKLDETELLELSELDEHWSFQVDESKEEPSSEALRDPVQPVVN